MSQSVPNIQAQMAAALAKRGQQDPSDVLVRMQNRVVKEKSLLAQMIDNAKEVAQTESVVKTQARAAKQTSNVEEDLRSVFALISDEREEVYIVITKEYRNKNEEQALDVARRYMKNKKKIQLLLADENLKAVQYADMVPLHQAEVARANAHTICEDAGYEVLSPKPIIEGA